MANWAQAVAPVSTGGSPLAITTANVNDVVWMVGFTAGPGVTITFTNDAVSSINYFGPSVDLVQATGFTIRMAWGIVNSTGSHTVTCTAGGPAVDSLTAGSVTPPTGTISVAQDGTQASANANNASIAFPSRAPSGPNGFYLGYAPCVNDGVAGSSTGFSYFLDAILAVTTYSLDPTSHVGAAPNPSAPTATATGNGWDALGALLIATIPTPPIVVASSGQVFSNSLAAFTAWVNPQGQSTTVAFNYGSTSGYGSSTGTVATITGPAPVYVSFPLTGLSAGQTVHFQVTATNTSGTTNGPDTVLTTAPAPRFSGGLGTSALGALELGGPANLGATVTNITSAVAVNAAVAAAGPRKAVALTSAVAVSAAVTAAGPVIPATTYRLFPTTNGPAATTAYSGPYGTGTAFTVTASGTTLDGYWWWVPPTGGSTAAQTFCLWLMTGVNTGTLISGSTVTSGTLSPGWNFIPLSPPLALTSGTPYKAATAWNSTGGFPYTPGFYGTGGPGVGGITNGPLMAYSDDPGSGGTNTTPFGDSQSSFQTASADPTTTYPDVGSASFNGWLDVDITGGSGTSVALTSAVAVSAAVAAAGPTKAVALTSAVAVSAAVAANASSTGGGSATATGQTPIVPLGTAVSITAQATSVNASTAVVPFVGAIGTTAQSTTVNAGTPVIPVVRVTAPTTVALPGAITATVGVSIAVTASITRTGGPVALAPAPIFIRGRGQPPLPPVQYGPRYFTSLVAPVLPTTLTSAVNVGVAVTARLSRQVNLTAAVSVTATVAANIVSGSFASLGATFTATAAGTVSIPSIVISSRVTFDGGSPAITSPFLPVAGSFLVVGYYGFPFTAGTATISDTFGDTGGGTWTPFTNAFLTSTTAFGNVYGGWYRQIGTSPSSGTITVAVSGWTGGEQILCVDQVTTTSGTLSVPQSNCAKIDFPGTPANGSVSLPAPPAISSLVWSGSGSGARAVTPTVSSTGFTQLDLVNGATSLASATAYTIGAAPQTVAWQGLSPGQNNALFALEMAISTSLSATGTVGASFTGLANAGVAVSAAGTTSWNFTASAIGVVNVAGTGSVAASFTASATGTSFLPATGSATASFTATATGTVIPPGTGTAALAATFTAAATGTVVVGGTTGALTTVFTASAVGSMAVPGTGALTATFTASATGTVLNPTAGAGALSATFSGAAVGTVAVNGAGQLGAAFTAVATGTATTATSTGVLSTTFTASAAGKVVLAAAGAATFGFNAQGAGTGAAEGAANFTFVAQASGSHTTVGTPSEVIQAGPRVIVLQAQQRRGAD